MCRSTKHILPDDSESVNSFFQIFSKNFKFSFLPRKARHPQGFSGDPASPGLPAGNCRQQRNSEENTEIRNIEHKSAELLRSKPEADIVGHVTSLMPVIPVRHAAANRKRKPKLLRLTLTSARQRSETRPQSGQQKEGENFHLLRAVREAAARYAAVMTFPQDNMSLQTGICSFSFNSSSAFFFRHPSARKTAPGSRVQIIPLPVPLLLFQALLPALLPALLLRFLLLFLPVLRVQTRHPPALLPSPA